MAEKSSKLFADETTGCENTEIVRLVRQTPPSHCALKIESFSLVRETFARNKNDKFESTEFSAGGHTWILSIYLKGKSEENGEGHISFYVRLVDKLNAGNFVYAILSFFVYDQIQDNYLIIQDLKEKRFQTFKTEWGISKALEVSTFEDTSNGFIMNDCCIFGAEVLVGDYKPTGLFLVDPQTIRTYTWRVTELFKECVTSPTFTIDGRQWQLSVWPKGSRNEKGKHISAFLSMIDASEFTGGSKLYVEYDLIVKNQLKEDDHKKTFGNWFTMAHKGWGTIRLIPLNDVDNPSKGFKVNDVIVIEVKINVIFILKDV